MSLPEFPQIDLRKRRRPPHVRSPKRRTCDPFPRRGPAAPGAAGPYARLPAGPSRLPGTPSIWWRAGRCSALARTSSTDGGTGEKSASTCAACARSTASAQARRPRTAPFRCRPCLSSACPAFSSVYESRCLSENRQGDPPDTFGEGRHRFQPTIRSFAIQNRWL